VVPENIHTLRGRAKDPGNSRGKGVG